MGVGIKIRGGADIRIINCTFSDLDGGIDAKNCSDLQLLSNHFTRVQNPVKAILINGLIASGNVERSVVLEEVNRFKMTLLTILVKRYMMHLKGN